MGKKQKTLFDLVKKEDSNNATLNKEKKERIDFSGMPKIPVFI